MDGDLDDLSREQLIAELVTLRNAVRAHRDSSGHELCWHHPALWSLLPETSEASLDVPEWPAFLRGCVRYRQSLDEQLPNAPRTSGEASGMHAVVRETTYPEDVRIGESPGFQEFQREHAGLKGYLGSVMVDAGAGRHLTLTLWNSADDMHAGREAMTPVVERTVNPLMTSPAKLLAAGPVVVIDVLSGNAGVRHDNAT